MVCICQRRFMIIDMKIGENVQYQTYSHTIHYVIPAKPQADPRFLEKGVVCTNVWGGGVALLILSHFSIIP